MFLLSYVRSFIEEDGNEVLVFVHPVGVYPTREQALSAQEEILEQYRQFQEKRAEARAQVADQLNGDFAHDVAILDDAYARAGAPIPGELLHSADLRIDEFESSLRRFM